MRVLVPGLRVGAELALVEHGASRVRMRRVAMRNLVELARLRREVDELVIETVAAARMPEGAGDWEPVPSWAEIGEILGVHPHTAAARFAPARSSEVKSS